MSQGGHANTSGTVLEQLVVSTLAVHGFELVSYRDFACRPARYSGRDLLLRHVPYQTIYGGRGYTEFLIKSRRFGLETRVECKWQSCSGSIDEKLPFTYLSCAEAVPENHIIILIDGDGFREGGITWLREAANSNKYVPREQPHKNIQVMNSMEFLTWSNQTFRRTG